MLWLDRDFASDPAEFCGVRPYGVRDIAESVMRARLALLDASRVEWSEVLGATEGLSHADLARACEHAAKKAILAHRTRIETSELVEALSERRAAQG